MVNPCYLVKLMTFFASICKIHPQLRKLPPNDSVSNIPILEICSVAKKLKALDSRKSSYPSEIQIKLIIECADLLSTPLTAIFNQCFIDGVFPCIFKTGVCNASPQMQGTYRYNRDEADFKNSSSLKSI